VTREKLVHQIRNDLQVIISAEETTGPKIFEAVKRIDRVLDSLVSLVTCPLEKDCPLARELQKRPKTKVM
jgi:CRISPR/Cas system Type II protein with McrA/HNH and RuvC-like nuclease domain